MTRGELGGVLFLLAVMPVLAAGLVGTFDLTVRSGTTWQSLTTAATSLLLVVLTCVGANYVYYAAMHGTVGGAP